VVTSRQKTGTHVSVPVPSDVAKELLSALNGNPVCVFWTGNGEERTAVSHWEDGFRTLFKDASITSGGNMVSHRLRDNSPRTFCRTGFRWRKCLSCQGMRASRQLSAIMQSGSGEGRTGGTRS
jgi:hypothetical protein